jgi:hypothetical protein
MSENVGASTSRNPKGLHGLHGDNLPYLTLIISLYEHLRGLLQCVVMVIYIGVTALRQPTIFLVIKG